MTEQVCLIFIIETAPGSEYHKRRLIYVIVYYPPTNTMYCCN